VKDAIVERNAGVVEYLGSWLQILVKVASQA
jgi:hypothetical protein